ncbi:MAG: transmembrane anchor protein [Azoarcus sp. PHD]|nr:MAG: transmembrane anchor protein [Azoarcus sp. PHD]
MYNTDLPNRAELPSTGKLLRSTAIAALVAVASLVTTVLPAEYGIDPTGIGRSLGLTQMGEIKVALAAEATVADTPPAKVIQVTPATAVADGHDHDHPSAAPVVATVSPVEPTSPEVLPPRRNTVTVKLKPGEAAEVKLTMRKDASVRFEWTSAGGPVNYDTHGDPFSAPKGFYHGYGKGRNETGISGTLQAAFDGKHGWYWRNRSGAEVTVTLKTDGDYDSIERVL